MHLTGAFNHAPGNRQEKQQSDPPAELGATLPTQLFQEMLMNRRYFVRTAAAFAALTAAELAPWQAMSAFAREVEDFVRGPAVKDHPLRQVSKHVWMIYSPDGFPDPGKPGNDVQHHLRQ
jgi:hypothetical protein